MMKRRNLKENYQWIPVPRALVLAQEPLLKRDRGIFAYYIRMCAFAAYKSAVMLDGKFREGVGPGEWFGGVNGLKKATIGTGSDERLERKLRRLARYKYIALTVETHNNLHTTIKYNVASHYVLFHDPHETPRHFVKEATIGFFGIFRDALIPLMADADYRFSRLDAWYDLYLHTVLNDYDCPQSFFAPVIQIDGMSVLSYAFLAKRWRWSKTAVANFFHAFRNDFSVVKMAGNYGSTICNTNSYLLQEYGIESDVDFGKIVCCVEEAIKEEKEALGIRHTPLQEKKGRVRPFYAISKCIVRNAQRVLNFLRANAYIPKSRIQDAAIAEGRGSLIYNDLYNGSTNYIALERMLGIV